MPHSTVGAEFAALDVRQPTSLRSLRDAAIRGHPTVRVAEEAVATAKANERQAHARANPVLSYGREQTARTGQSNGQDIAQVELPIELSGARGARIAAARARREAAEARLADARLGVDTELLNRWVDAVSAAHSEALATRALRAASEARRVADERLRAGDVAGYAARRLRLEAGRYAAQRAQAAVAARAAREQLALLANVALDQLALPVPVNADSGGRAAIGEAFSRVAMQQLPPELLSLVNDSATRGNQAHLRDSLLTRAKTMRLDVRAAALDEVALRADATAVARERIPVPTLSAGYKGEQVRSGPTLPSMSLSGFVAGVSLPLPVFDRRAGAVMSAQATARLGAAESVVLGRRVAHEVTAALHAVQASDAGRAELLPYVGVEADAALRGVQAAYAEGEITLAEWLDAVRAWHDADVALLLLETERALRRVALARAAGLPLFPSSGVR